MHSNNVLGLLAENYISSSEDESTESEREGLKRKREESPKELKKLRSNESKDEESETTITSGKLKAENLSRLPLPSSISTMFSDQIGQHEDNPTDHQGRVRTFKHETGNWASFVYVSYESKDIFHTLIKSILKICSTYNIILEPFQDLHLSISKTVVIRHHWIKTLTTELQKKFSHFNKFLVCLKSLEVYTNEDKTRSFIGMKAHVGYSELKSAVDLVDECFAEFKLSPFYKPPSFHVSLAWCNGDYYNKLTKLIPHLQEICEDFVQKTADCRNILVDNLKFKTGNKIYTINLKNK